MVSNPLGNRELIRAINRSTVLNVVKTTGPIARTDLARMTGLSPATISGITADLIDEDLIYESASGDSRGGRRPILLALNPLGGYVVGIKLTESFVVGALTDLEATVLHKRTLRIKNHQLNSVVATIAHIVRDLADAIRIPPEDLMGVGIGLAGIIDANNSLLRHSPIFSWSDTPLVEALTERLNIPIYIDNDVNTLTLTERLFGAGQGVDNFLTVTVGRGVGLGIVLNGQLYRGAQGGAGEFGHTVVDPDGLLCECGKQGCLETFVSDPALVAAAGRAYENGEMAVEINDIEALVELARSGNSAAVEIFRTAGEKLGQGIANLINLFNPVEVILSGEGLRAGDLLFDPLRSAVDRHVMTGLADDTEIRIDEWEDDAWARGAASLVLLELFKSPFHAKSAASAK